MVVCFAPMCSHNNQRDDCSFFGFPRDEAIRKRWIVLIRRGDRFPGMYSRICSCHFVDQDRKNGPTLFPYNDTDGILVGSSKKSPKTIRPMANPVATVSLTTASDLKESNNSTSVLTPISEPSNQVDDNIGLNPILNEKSEKNKCTETVTENASVESEGHMTSECKEELNDSKLKEKSHDAGIKVNTEGEELKEIKSAELVEKSNDAKSKENIEELNSDAHSAEFKKKIDDAELKESAKEDELKNEIKSMELEGKTCDAELKDETNCIDLKGLNGAGMKTETYVAAVKKDNSAELKHETSSTELKEGTNCVKSKDEIIEIESNIKKPETEETMDTGTEEKKVADAPMEVDVENMARLVIDGINDDSEEAMTLTVEEAQNYIRGKVKEYMKDPKVNPLLVLQNGISEFHNKIQQKNEDFNRLSKVFEVLYRDQVKFLRHIGVMSRAETKTVGVGVDLPWLPETMSTLINSEAAKQENAPSSSNVALPNVNAPPKKDAKKEPSGPVECIDLTDDDPPPPAAAPVNKENISNSANAATAPTRMQLHLKHPAPLPTAPMSGILYPNEAPKPSLKISEDDKCKGSKGIVLQWDLPVNLKSTKVKAFEIYGYQEKPFVQITPALWKKIGSVDPMALPMSCTLTQFQENFRYHFAVRAVSTTGRYGSFSDPKSIWFSTAKAKN